MSRTRSNRAIAEQLIDCLLNDEGIDQIKSEDDIETITELVERALHVRVEECAKIVIMLHENGEMFDSEGAAVAGIRKLNEVGSNG